MKITTKPLESRRVEVYIELGEERTEEVMRKAAHRISRNIDIPGFRRGKAPYGTVLRRYGERTLRQEAVNSFAEDIIQEALEKEEIYPSGPVSLGDVTLDPIVFTVVVPLSPVVELGDYRDYRREMPTVEVSEEDVQERLDELRRENTVLEPVDRPAALGDVVEIDLVIEKDTEVVLEQKDFDFLLDAENERPAPGFSEALVGMEVGQEETFTLKLSDDLSEENLRGQEADFTVDLKDVYKRILPDVDDDLARTVGSYDSLEDLKDHVRRQLSEQAWEEAESEYARQVVEDIVERSRVEYPPHILEEALDDALKRFEESLQRQQHLTLEDYLRFQGQTEEDLRESLEPQARESLETSLVLGRVVHLENLAVDEDELDQEIEGFLRLFGDRAGKARAEMESEERRKEVLNRLLTNKAIKRLVAIAKGEAPPLDDNADEDVEEESETEPEATERGVES